MNTTLAAEKTTLSARVKTPLKEKPRVGVLYIRESTEEQDKGFSPQNQENMMRKYAEEHSINVTAVYKDLISGTNASKRDDFQRMINDAMLKKFQVILVFHTSRFARNVGEARQYKELLREKQGIEVIFITQQFGHYEDPSAFLNEGVNELFDEYYSRNLSFWVKSNLMEKRRQGYQRGNPPFAYYKKRLGYDKEKNRAIYSKDWLINPAESKSLSWIYKTYASGLTSMTELAFELNKRGLKTKKGNPFTHSSVKDILKNRIYLGVIPAGDKRLPEIPGKHPPILKEPLFNRVQEMIMQRRTRTGRPVAPHRFFLLKGQIYCFNCFNRLQKAKGKKQQILSPTMYAQTNQWNDSGGVHQESHCYICKFRRENKTCDQPSIDCKILDNQVHDIFECFRFPDKLIEKITAQIKKMYEDSHRSQKHTDQVESLLKRKKKLTLIYTQTDQYTDIEYVAKIKKVDSELQKYEALGFLQNNAKLKQEQYVQLTDSFLREFKTFWLHDLSKEDQRAWVQAITKRIWVKESSIVAIEPQEDFKPFFVSLRKLMGQSPSGTPKKSSRLYRDDFFIRIILMF